MMFGWQHLSESDCARILRGIARARAFGGPYHLEIHPTNRCNLGCFFCSARSHRHGEELPWEVLRGVIDRAEDLRSVRLTGGGESLIYPQTGALLDLLGERGIRINDLTTNGVELAAWVERLIAVGTDEVAVSLNEPTREGYAETMRVKPETFDRALESIEALNVTRRAARGDAFGP